MLQGFAVAVKTLQSVVQRVTSAVSQLGCQIALVVVFETRPMPGVGSEAIPLSWVHLLDVQLVRWLRLLWTQGMAECSSQLVLVD